MDDETDVRAIDAHSECHGGHDDVGALGCKRVLRVTALLRAHARVISPRPAAARRERSGHGIDVLAADAVDDACFSRMAADHFLDLQDFVGTRNDAVAQVRPIEIADQDHRLPQPQLAADVGAHLLCRRSREGVNRRTGKELAQLAELAVFGTEIVSPVADAMRLVHGERAHASLAQQCAERRSGQPLRRHEQQPQRTVGRPPLDGALILARRHAVQCRRGHADRHERVHLVLHQSDQRRHDDREPVEQQRRRLKAERLPSPGRHHQQRVTSGEHSVDGLALQRKKGGKAPRALDDVLDGIDDFGDGAHTEIVPRQEMSTVSRRQPHRRLQKTETERPCYLANRDDTRSGARCGGTFLRR